MVSIKGPGFRLSHDVRRVWKCPQCRRRRKTAGHVIAQRCNCTKQRIWMQLIEEQQTADAAEPTTEDQPAPDAEPATAAEEPDAEPAAAAEEPDAEPATAAEVEVREQDSESSDRSDDSDSNGFSADIIE